MSASAKMERSGFALLWYSRRGLTRSSKFLVLPTLSRNTKVERVDQAYFTVGAVQAAGAAATFSILPLAQKIVDRITRIIDQELATIDAQKVSFPSLCSSNAWKKTGRWDSYGSVLFRLHDRAKAPLCLGPTHEETVTQCIAAIGASDITPKLPLKLYQTSWKYRDEPRPKQGLMRAREFLMNDMYSFHVSEADCRKTYDQVTEAYTKIFSRIGLPIIRAVAGSGEMGGSYSHEYHYELPKGEDRVSECGQCREYFNLEATLSEGRIETDANRWQKHRCPRCRGVLEPQRRCVEVAHTFMLGDSYSKKLKANCLVDHKPVPLEMGCYGIGITRILSAAAQFSPDVSLSLPVSIAPFTVAVIGPKPGAVDFDKGMALAEEIANQIDKSILPGGRVILDDRAWTIGRRLKEQQSSWTSFCVVVGKNMQLELHQFATDGPSKTDAMDSGTTKAGPIEPRFLSDKSAVYDFFVKLRQRFQMS